MVFRGLTEPGTAKPPKSAQFGQFWRFGRAWLRQPSEFYDEINFLGINCCSTYKKVSKDPHFISIYFREYEIHYYQAVTYLLTFHYVHSVFVFDSLAGDKFRNFYRL